MSAPAVATVNPVATVSIVRPSLTAILDPFGPVAAVDTYRLLIFTDYDGWAFITSLSPDLVYPCRFVLPGYDRCVPPDIMAANIAAIVMIKVTVMPWTVVLVHINMKPYGMERTVMVEMAVAMTTISDGIIIVPWSKAPILKVAVPPHAPAAEYPVA
jgi:hypothetical protein